MNLSPHTVSASTKASADAEASGSQPCPACDPNDANCGCGERRGGSWRAGTSHQMASRIFPDQQTQCNGLSCTCSIRVRIHGIRVFHESVRTDSNECTCLFYTTFQIEFLHTDIQCPGGVHCNDFSTYLNGGDLWPGRWIAPGGCLEKHVKWYLRECVKAPTFEGFNLDKFLQVAGNVPPNCNGELQIKSGCPADETSKCPDLPAQCP